jgi:hypothetical protein
MDITGAPKYSIRWHRVTLHTAVTFTEGSCYILTLHTAVTFTEGSCYTLAKLKVEGPPVACVDDLFCVFVVITDVLEKWCKPEIGIVMNAEFFFNLNIMVYGTIILPVFLYGCETWLLTLREELG